VIDDARARHRRERWIGAVVIAALAVAGLIIGFFGGGGGSGGNGVGLGGLGAPLPSETLSLRAPRPEVLTHAIRRCDRQAMGRHGLGSAVAQPPKNPFAKGLVLSGVAGSVVGLIAVVDDRELSCVIPIHPGGYFPSGGGEGPVELAPASNKITGGGWGTMGALLGSVSESQGRVGPNLSAVEFVLAHHRAVRARVENGWYLALWPQKAQPGTLNSRGPSSVLVTTSSGTISSPMPGARCDRRPSACVFVKSLMPAVPQRPNPSMAAPGSSSAGAAGPTLRQLLANFAILRRRQTAADRSWKPPCDCGTTVQIRNLTRLATTLPNGYRVFLDVKRATNAGSQYAPGSYLLGLNLVGRSGGATIVEFGRDTQYSIDPISTGRMASRGSPLYAPNGNQAFASVVPDGVAAVRWTINVRCPKLASSHGVHCPATGMRTFIVPVVNNVAARTLAGVDSDPFYANISKITWLGRDGRVITAFGGYGNLAAPPFLAGHLNTGNRQILTGTGIAGARIGEPTADAIHAITRLLGPAAYTNAAASGCGVDHQTVWESPTTADPLTLYSQAGRFVGYQYGVAPKLIAMRQGPGAVLTTKEGLTLSMPISAAKRLYPNQVSTASTPRLGRFSITGQTNRIYGYALPNTYPARSVSGKDPIATIGAGNTGCPQTA
jgi:hypothetical protein